MVLLHVLGASGAMWRQHAGGRHCQVTALGWPSKDTSPASLAVWARCYYPCSPHPVSSALVPCSAIFGCRTATCGVYNFDPCSRRLLAMVAKARPIWAEVPPAHLLVYALSVALVGPARARGPETSLEPLDFLQPPLPSPALQALFVGNCMRPLGTTPQTWVGTTDGGAAPTAAAHTSVPARPSLKGPARIEECKRRVASCTSQLYHWVQNSSVGRPAFLPPTGACRPRAPWRSWQAVPPWQLPATAPAAACPCPALPPTSHVCAAAVLSLLLLQEGRGVCCQAGGPWRL